jgi:hypothetical protein
MFPMIRDSTLLLETTANSISAIAHMTFAKGRGGSPIHALILIPFGS